MRKAPLFSARSEASWATVPDFDAVLAAPAQATDVLRRHTEQAGGLRSAQPVVGVATGADPFHRRPGGFLEHPGDLPVGHVRVAVDAHRVQFAVVDHRVDLAVGEAEQPGGVGRRVQRPAELVEAGRRPGRQMVALRRAPRRQQPGPAVRVAAFQHPRQRPPFDVPSSPCAAAPCPIHRPGPSAESP